MLPILECQQLILREILIIIIGNHYRIFLYKYLRMQQDISGFILYNNFYMQKLTKANNFDKLNCVR